MHMQADRTFEVQTPSGRREMKTAMNFLFSLQLQFAFYACSLACGRTVTDVKEERSLVLPCSIQTNLMSLLRESWVLQVLSLTTWCRGCR